jgi:mono/diheme cytochrome c family protein
MKTRHLCIIVLFAVSTACFAVADGSWLKKVPAADHARVNPLAGNADAVASGANLFANNCAKCHGPSGAGKGSRPSLKSDRIAAASDGDLAWLLKNGNPYRGMPGWGALPEQERWQLVAFVRSLNTATSTTGVQQ